MSQLLAGWQSASTWESEISQAIAEPDPMLSNLKVTRVHYLLGQALSHVIGEETGANFHSWAVWGSRKAGATVRQEDLDSALLHARVVAGAVGLVVGTALALVIVTVANWAGWLVGLGAVLGVVCGTGAGDLLARRSRRAAARQILVGNRIVLGDIGRVSAQYIEAFAADREPHPERLAAFLATLRPGSTESGGQDLLRRAFEYYDFARISSDLRLRHEAAYFANCLVVLHEHIRLQPHIVSAMPFIVRKCVTERQMTFDIGAHQLAVSHDVPPIGAAPFPETLSALTDPALLDFLHGTEGWAVSKDRLENTRASDWTKIQERMGYIVQLFRTRHTDLEVCSSPYATEELEGIRLGVSPAKL